ncbi:MAG: DUF2066 domain-containing protein [Psychromonas sp.]|nr:DUF2066 domain-containing protein [Psychromonas sp.]
MKSILLKATLVLFCASYASFALSLNFDAPYLGNVIAHKLDEKTLQTTALAQVLVKVSGNSSIVSVLQAKELLKHPESMLSQSGYQTYNNTEYYFALFDKLKINNFLVNIKQPVWGGIRPKTLVWLAVQSDNGKEIMSDSSVLAGSDFQLIEQPRARGIKLDFPIMDIEDNSITISDLIGKFYNNIAKASARYDVEYFVVAKMQQLSDTSWRLNWSLLYYNLLSKKNNEIISKTLIGSRADVETKMVNQIADFYVSRYAVTRSLGDNITQDIYVNGIQNYKEFSLFINFLTKLHSVSLFRLKKINMDQIDVAVKINGGLESFKNALNLNKHLLMIAPPKVDTPIEDEKPIVDVVSQANGGSVVSDAGKAVSDSAAVESEAASAASNTGLVVSDAVAAAGDTDKKAVKAEVTVNEKVIVADPLYFNWH